jgi:23S rRNA (guanosine2251-2'-O)-methyltransferase
MSRRKHAPRTGGHKAPPGSSKSGPFGPARHHAAPRPEPAPADRSAPRDRGLERSQSRPPARQGAESGLWLYGLHAVAAALANPQRRWRRLVASPDARDALSQSLSASGAPRTAEPEVMPRDSIDRLLPPGSVHQGVALQVEPLDELPLDAVLDSAAAAPDAVIMVLDQVTDPHNVGAILRSAAAFGARAVILPERHAPRMSGVLAKSASGAADVIPVLRVVNLSRALRQMKDAGFWCVGLDAAAGQTMAEADLSGRIALVLGAEGEGLRRLTRETCDMTLRLPTNPPIASLNVSNAAAVALYEIARRRGASK